MSDWRDRGRREDDTKRYLLIGAGAAVAILAWMYVSRPGEEQPASRGFDLGDSGPPPSGISARPFMSNGQKTGLDFVGKIGADASLSARSATAPAPPPAAAAPEAPAQASAAELSAADKQQADRVGVPKTPAEAAKFGGSASAFAAVFSRIANYPRVVGYLLNNKYVVEGYLNRDSSRKILNDPNGVISYLSDVNRPDGVGKSLPILQAMLRENPQIAGVIAGSALAHEVMETPGFKGFVNNPAGAVMANPALLGVVTDPNVLQGFAANPESATTLAAFQQNSGGVK